jgi:hypothetical protein
MNIGILKVSEVLGIAGVFVDPIDDATIKKNQYIFN